ncbi:hypothetical protein L204_102398 [Cryptococcus depauperatus]|nr:hypothetical protein L204_05899 [Cryptococcus depauperatus CBS 7855]
MPTTQQQAAGLGIEDELTFGSDEDLIADVGEITLPAHVTEDIKPSEKRSSGKFKLASKKKGAISVTDDRRVIDVYPRENREKDKKDRKRAKAFPAVSLVIDPRTELALNLSNPGSYTNSLSGSSTPSLPSLTSSCTEPSSGGSRRAKGGFRNALKGLSMKKVNGSVSVNAARQRGLNKCSQVMSVDSYSTGELSLQRSANSFFSGYSFSRTNTARSVHPPTSVNSLTQKNAGSGYSESTSASSTSQPTSQIYNNHPPITKAILKMYPETQLDRHASRGTMNSQQSGNPPLISLPPSLSPSLYSILLPAFPTTVQSLENISILQATVIRGAPVSMSSRKEASSFNSISLGNVNTKRLAWTSQLMVLTSFKLEGSAPLASPISLEAKPANGREEATESLHPPEDTHQAARTIAHLHLFPLAKTSPVRTKPFTLVQPQRQLEMERMMICSETTAGFWGDTGSERKYVMRVGFGYGKKGEEKEGEGIEWFIEIGSLEQLREWIQQIKSIAVVIRAEKEGHGPAIHEVFNSGAAKGDDLALALSLQRRTPSQDPKTRPKLQSSSNGNGCASVDSMSDHATLSEQPEPAHSPAFISSTISALMASPNPNFANILDSDEAARAESPILPQEFLPKQVKLSISAYPSPSDPKLFDEMSSDNASPNKKASGNHFTAKLGLPPPSAPLSTPLLATPVEMDLETQELTEAERIRYNATLSQSTPIPPSPSLTIQQLPSRQTRDASGFQSSESDTQSARSIPSVSSKTSTMTSKKIFAKKIAVDIMSEFNESGAANYEVEDEGPIDENRPRAIRFA